MTMKNVKSEKRATKATAGKHSQLFINNFSGCTDTHKYQINIGLIMKMIRRSSSK